MKTATMPACRALPTAAAWPAAPHQLHPALGLLRLRDQGAVRPLEHKFDNRWKAKLNVSRVETELDRFWVYMGGAITRRPLAGAVWRGGHIQSGNTQEVVDLSLGGPFQLMGRTHELLLGRGTGSAWKASGKAPISRAAARGQHPFAPSIWTPPTETYFTPATAPGAKSRWAAMACCACIPRTGLHLSWVRAPAATTPAVDLEPGCAGQPHALVEHAVQGTHQDHALWRGDL